MPLFTVDLLSKLTSQTVHRRAVRVVIEREGHYLMVTSRFGDAKFPGGGQDQHETDWDTAKRELQEETGYSLDHSYFQLIGEVIERRPGVEIDTSLVMTSVYYSTRLASTSAQTTALEGYEIEYQYRPVWCTLEQAYAMNEIAYQRFPSDVPWCIREMKLIDYLRHA